MPQIRLVVLASGSGSLFQALIDWQSEHKAKIVGLITDVQCQAVKRAESANIPVEVIENAFPNILASQEVLSSEFVTAERVDRSEEHTSELQSH